METKAHDAALAFMRNNQAQHLSRDRQQLVDRCTVNLQQKFDISTSRAERISVRALGEVESAGKVHFDLAASTDTHVVARIQKTGETFVLTAATIIEAARQHAIPIHPH